MAPAGPLYVQVPLDLPRVSDAALTLWVLLVHRAGTRATCWPGQRRLQADLGRPGSDPGHVQALVAELTRAGMCDIVRRYVGGKTRNVYRPLRRVCPGDGRRYIELPAGLLDAVADATAGPEHVAAAVRWLDECRQRGGWTPAGVAELAARWGQSVSTTRRHRSTLVRLCVLTERTQPGRAPLTAPPGRLPAPRTPVTDPRSARSPIPDDPGHATQVAPVTDPGQNYPHRNHSNEIHPDDNYPSVPVGTAVTAVDAHARTSAAAPRDEISPQRHPHTGQRRRTGSASSSALAVLAGLPRAWRLCPAWVRRRMAARLDRALTAGYGAPAIVGAVQRYAPEPATLSGPGGPLSDQDAERHTRALDRVLALLAGDVKAGHCPDCGHDRQDTGHGCHAPAGDQLDEPAPGAALWLAGDPGRCVACDELGGVARPDLPLASLVCDPCWTQHATAGAA